MNNEPEVEAEVERIKKLLEDIENGNCIRNRTDSKECEDCNKCAALAILAGGKLVVLAEEQTAPYHCSKPNCIEGCQLQGRLELYEAGFRRVIHVTE